MPKDYHCAWVSGKRDGGTKKGSHSENRPSLKKIFETTEENYERATTMPMESPRRSHEISLFPRGGDESSLSRGVGSNDGRLPA